MTQTHLSIVRSNNKWTFHSLNVNHYVSYIYAYIVKHYLRKWNLLLEMQQIHDLATGTQQKHWLRVTYVNDDPQMPDASNWK